MINEEYNNLPRDVIKSLAKMEKIIKIIETNLFLPKDDILREINIEIGSTQKPNGPIIFISSPAQ